MPIDLAKIRKLAGGKTQQSIAKAAGISHPCVGMMLSGKIDNPRISTLDKLAKAFGVRVSELLK